jgi:hypothetical protein
MKRTFSWLLATALMVATSSAALAASGWDGTWSGAWGGDPSQATSVTVAGNRVLSYTYQGVLHPMASNVTASQITYQERQITYQDQGSTVTFTKRSETTAEAALRTPQFLATAVFTRQ